MIAISAATTTGHLVGEGMVLKPEPIFECLESLGISGRDERRREGARETVVLLSPQGAPFDQAVARNLTSRERIVLICGRYEGVDERVSEYLADRAISVGDFASSGGELGAAIILDTATRLLPGVRLAMRLQCSRSRLRPLLRRKEQRAIRRLRLAARAGLLDYPHYTRPAQFRGMTVPEVLANGNHEEIRQWRRRCALQKTQRNRPDLLRDAELSEEDRKLLAEIEGKESHFRGTGNHTGEHKK